MGDGELFGAPGGFRQRVERLFRVSAEEVVAEGFAFLAEAEAGEGEEGRRVVDLRSHGQKADDGGIDFGRRAEGGARYGEEDGGFGGELGLNGEIAVVAGARGGGDAVGDFELDEEDGALERGADREGFFDDGRGDVIGQVAGEGGGAPGGEIGFEDVPFDDFEARVGTEAGAKVLGEDGVDLDGDDARGMGEKVGGEGAAAGADFDDGGGVGFAGGGGDALEGGLVGEEVLAEAASHERLTAHVDMAVAQGEADLPGMGWPNSVAGVKTVKRRLFSMPRRRAPEPAPLTMEKSTTRPRPSTVRSTTASMAPKPSGAMFFTVAWVERPMGTSGREPMEGVKDGTNILKSMTAEHTPPAKGTARGRMTSNRRRRRRLQAERGGRARSAARRERSRIARERRRGTRSGGGCGGGRAWSEFRRLSRWAARREQARHWRRW